MKPIRVLQMIGSLNIGGSQSMIMDIYRKINKEEIQFDFIIDHADHLFYAEEIQKMGGRIYTLPSFTGKNVFIIKKAWKDFFDGHPEHKILHSHVRSYASIYISIAKKHGVKTIIHSHSTSNGKGASSLVKACLQYPLRFEADYFFSCSKKAGEWLFGKNVVNGNRYYAIKNAIDTNKYILSTEIRDKYRQKLGIKDEKVLIHVGRLHPAKNHDFLLDVFSEYLKDNVNAKLLLVGDGELRTNIENKICSLGMENKVIMLGNRNDVANLLQVADIFLFPSSWEGLPVTVIEAQAAGLPCLISDYVTKEVAISRLVNYLPIDQGVEVWIKKLNDASLVRKNVLKEIKQSGFDVEETTKWITNFYKKLDNKYIF